MRSRRPRRYRFAFALALLAGWPLPGQPQDVRRFEVASVRADDTTRPTGMRLLPTGQFTATRATLHDLMLRAWNVHESQVVGGPAWIRSDRYEILARAETPPPGGTPDLLAMLRTLLAERFGLRVRSERQPLAAYVLRSRAPGRLGPDIRRSTLDCAANTPSAVPNTITLSADGWPPCGLTLVRTLLGETRRRTEMTQAAVPIAELAFRLQSVVGRPVVDQTGLTGEYDLRFAFAQQVASEPAGVASAPDAPDLFTALERQLGFDLKSERTEVPVLVIEAVEHPSAN